MSDATSGVVRKMTSTNHGARVARLIWMGCNLERGRDEGVDVDEDEEYESG